MANLRLDFYNGETQYSDGDIEKEIFDIVKNNNEFDEIIEKDRRWPVLYHLSHLRQDLLNWYPFKKDSRVLEVGAGCGALTGLLCRNCRHVIAAELTKQRAEINFERNKSYDNLDIFAGDIFKMNFTEKFDYITLIGVLEYAAFMSQSLNPYEDMLKKLKSMLSDDGHILIAIENRFGLKYFAGAREDHTAKFFDGINGYSNDSKVRTFTKKELEELLVSAGLKSYKFFYPLPDYKFTKMIYTDETIGKIEENINLKTLDRDRYEIFNEDKTMRQLSSEGVLATFSNSFLIDAGPDETGILMAKMSTERKKEYRIVTIIKKDGDKKIVEKVAVTEEAKDHLKKMYNNRLKYKNINGFELADCYKKDDTTIGFEFVKGDNFSKLLEDYVIRNDKEELYKKIDFYFEQIFLGTNLTSDYYGDKFKIHFGDRRYIKPLHCADVCEIDLSFNNIIFSNNGVKQIDYEWIVEFPVPVEFICWRALRYADVLDADLKLKQDLFSRCGITNEMIDVFSDWDSYFLQNHVKSFNISKYTRKNKQFDFNRKRDINDDMSNKSAVYFDCGKGFSEQNKAVSADFHANVETEFEIKIENCDNLKAIRFNPVEGYCCQCKILSIKGNSGEFSYIPINSVITACDGEVFLSTDPGYLIQGNLEGIKHIRIKYIVRLYSFDNATEKIRNLYGELYREFSKVISSKSWRITSPLRKIHRKIR